MKKSLISGIATMAIATPLLLASCTGAASIPTSTTTPPASTTTVLPGSTTPPITTTKLPSSPTNTTTIVLTGTVEIEFTRSGFSPASVNIAAGSTIKWFLAEHAEVTVVSDTPGVSGFTDNFFINNPVYTTFTVAGVYNFHLQDYAITCTITVV